MADSIAKRELRLELKFSADTKQGGYALKALANDAEKLNKHTSEAAKSLLSIGQASARQGTGGGGGGGPGSSAAADALGGAGGKLLKGATIAVAATGVVNVAAAIAKLGDEGVSARAKLMGLAQAVPIFGGTISHLADTLFDLANRVSDPEGYASRRREIANAPVEMAKLDAKNSFAQRTDPLRREGRSLGFAAEAERLYPSLASQRAASGSVDNRDSRILAAEELVQTARRNQSIAQQEFDAAQGDATRATTARDRFLNPPRTNDRSSRAAQQGYAMVNEVLARAPARQESTPSRLLRYAQAPLQLLGGNTLGAANSLTGVDAGRQLRNSLRGASEDPAKAIRDQVREEKRLAEATNLTKAATEATERLQQRQMDLTRKKYELAKAETEVQKAKLSILDDQEKKLKEQASLAQQSAEQFGAYDPLKQSATVEALTRFKSGGRDSLTGDQLDLLLGTNVTSDFVRKQLGTQTASGSEEFKKLLGLTGQQDAKTIEQQITKITAEKMTIKSQVDIKLQFEEQALQDSFKKQFMDFLKTAFKNIAQEEGLKVTQAQIRKAAAQQERS